MSETLGALAYKTDVPERVKEQVQATATAVAGALGPLSAPDRSRYHGRRASASHRRRRRHGRLGRRDPLDRSRHRRRRPSPSHRRRRRGRPDGESRRILRQGERALRESRRTLAKPRGRSRCLRLKSIDPRITAGIGIFALGYIVGLTVAPLAPPTRPQSGPAAGAARRPVSSCLDARTADSYTPLVLCRASCGQVAESVDALDLGSSGATHPSSSLGLPRHHPRSPAETQPRIPSPPQASPRAVLGSQSAEGNQDVKRAHGECTSHLKPRARVSQGGPKRASAFGGRGGLGPQRLSSGSSSVVEHRLAKARVASSNLVFRSSSYHARDPRARFDPRILVSRMRTSHPGSVTRATLNSSTRPKSSSRSRSPPEELEAARRTRHSVSSPSRPKCRDSARAKCRGVIFEHALRDRRDRRAGDRRRRSRRPIRKRCKSTTSSRSSARTWS